MHKWYYKIKEVYAAHERLFSAGALLLGFVVDNFTLQRIDLLFENIVLLFYISLIIFSICIFAWHRERGGFGNSKLFRWFHLAAPFLMQYALGGLFSGLSIFYFRSAALTTSWPLLFIFLVVLIGNEIYAKKLRVNLPLQITVFYFAINTFFIFLMPIIVKQISLWVFILSGVVSLAVISGFIWLLRITIIREMAQTQLKHIVMSVGIVYICMNVFYFLNVIPPIPLSMKDRALAYVVVKDDDIYKVQVRDRAWWESFQLFETYYKDQQEPVYFFSSIFAPTRLQAQIVHEWQKKNTEGEWITISRIPFSIVGGRDGGYRGYSYSSKVDEGMWRVQTTLENGQIIGRKTFNVIYKEKGDLRELVF